MHQDLFVSFQVMTTRTFRNFAALLRATRDPSPPAEVPGAFSQTSHPTRSPGTCPTKLRTEISKNRPRPTRRRRPRRYSIHSYIRYKYLGNSDERRILVRRSSRLPANTDRIATAHWRADFHRGELGAPHLLRSWCSRRELPRGTASADPRLIGRPALPSLRYCQIARSNRPVDRRLAGPDDPPLRGTCWSSARPPR